MAKATQAAPGGRVFIARQSFSMTFQGQAINVVAGVTRVREGHDLLAGDRAQFFEPLEVHYDLEDTTSSKRDQAPPPAAPADPDPDPDPTPPAGPTFAERIDAVATHAQANELGTELGLTFEEKTPTVTLKKTALLEAAAALPPDPEAE